MSDLNVVAICTAANKGAAESLAAQYPGGSGTFSVQLTTASNGAPPATHWAGSGYMPADLVAAFEASSEVEVFSLDNSDFFSILAAHDPVLYRVIPDEVV
jgi:hypothetical protein